MDNIHKHSPYYAATVTVVWGGLDCRLLGIVLYLTPLNPLSVQSSVCPSGRITFLAQSAIQSSAGARKKPLVGGLNFLVKFGFGLEAANSISFNGDRYFEQCEITGSRP